MARLRHLLPYAIQIYTGRMYHSQHKTALKYHYEETSSPTRRNVIPNAKKRHFQREETSFPTRRNVIPNLIGNLANHLENLKPVLFRRIKLLYC
jgi:hypothetical protein